MCAQQVGVGVLGYAPDVLCVTAPLHLCSHPGAWATARRAAVAQSARRWEALPAAFKSAGAKSDRIWMLELYEQGMRFSAAAFALLHRADHAVAAAADAAPWRRENDWWGNRAARWVPSPELLLHPHFPLASAASHAMQEIVHHAAGQSHGRRASASRVGVACRSRVQRARAAHLSCARGRHPANVPSRLPWRCFSRAPERKCHAAPLRAQAATAPQCSSAWPT